MDIWKGRLVNWDAFIKEYGARLVLFAKTWTNNHAEAEDAVQNALIRLWKRGESEITPPLAFTAVKHAVLDADRGRRRRAAREAAAVEMEDRADNLFERRWDAAELEDNVERALATLSEKQREVLVMKIWGGLTFAGIGTVLKISPNTAATRYRSALAALKRVMEKKRNGDDG